MVVCAHRVYHLQIIRRIEKGWIHPPPFPVLRGLKKHIRYKRERERKIRILFFLQEKIIGYFSWFLMFLLLLLLLLLPLLLLLLLFLDIFTTVRGSDLEIPFIGCDKNKTYNYSRGSGFKLTSFGSDLNEKKTESNATRNQTRFCFRIRPNIYPSKLFEQKNWKIQFNFSYNPSSRIFYLGWDYIVLYLFCIFIPEIYSLNWTESFGTKHIILYK